MTDERRAGAAAEPPRIWLTAWALVLFAAALALDTRHNTFPFFYHPDESAKVDQVLTGEWNFHHPMLLLSTTSAVVKMLGVVPSEQPVVEAGRWVSAAFIAGAVVALALLAYAWRGWAASLAAGGALLLQHQLFELAHYMKEDSALLLGVALSFLTACAFWQKPGAGRAALLGAAVGVAISGKYIGVCMLAVALPVLWCAPGKKGRRTACFFGALAAVLVLVNLPLLLHLGAFENSLGREMESVVHGQRGMTRRVPHTQYWNIFRDNTTPVVWVLLAVFLAARWRERRAVSLAERLLIAFPFAYALALSFSPKSNDRYFLPATAVLTLLAACGAVDAARLLTRWLPLRWALAVCVAALVASEAVALPPPLDWRTFTEYFAAFQRDDNAEFLAWIRAELPPEAVIAKDSRIQLPDPGNKKDGLRFAPMPQKILAERFAADLGTLAELRARGVTHLAVSGSDYGRFSLPGLLPQPGERASFERRKAFYEALLRDGELVFWRERGTVLYLHPGIRLYRLPPPAE